MLISNSPPGPDSRTCRLGRLREAHAFMLLTAICGFALTGCARTATTATEPPRVGFTVLRAARTPDDKVPPEVADALAESQQPEFSLADIRASRRVLANTPAWLVRAANGETCFVRLAYPLMTRIDETPLGPIPTHHCVTESTAQAGGLVETQSLATSGTHSRLTKVLGIAPNDVAGVKILTRSGKSLEVAVVRNAYEAVVPQPTAVRFIFFGHRTSSAVVPLETFRSNRPSPQKESRRY